MEKKKIFTMVVVCFLVLAFITIPLTVSAADKKLTRKMILGGRLGDPWFVLSQALAYFVNKQSDWLRLEVVATPGVSAGAEIAMRDYEKYIYLAPWAGMVLNPTMKKMNYYDKERIVGFCAGNLWSWITYDKNIKTGQDLIGKKVFVGRPGGARNYFEEKVLEALDVKDKVKLLRGGYGGGRNAMRDGLADVAVMNFQYILPAGFKKSSFIEDLETRKPVYYINLMSRELLNKLEMVSVQIYAGALDKKTQKEALMAAIDSVFWCVDARMDEAVVKEVTRILYANADKFTSWHAQGASITKEIVCTYVLGPERMHPAAAAHYKSQGAKVVPLADYLP